MISRRRAIAGLAAVLGKGAASVTPANAEASSSRPTAWAQPIEAKGVPNLHQVDKNVFRSAQPNADGFKVLAAQYGVRTIVSLRAFNADEPLTRGLALRLVRYRIHTWHIEREDVVGALRSLRAASEKAPVLLHCQHGADRTGLITALYRILYQGWSKHAAADEMLNGNFGYHAVWGNIPRYVRKIDVVALRRDVGVP